MINSILLKEGQCKVSVFLILTVISAIFICSFLTTLLAIITIFLIYIYRTTSKNFMISDDILSPSDGKIVAIDRVDNKKIIYIKLSIFDGHVLRAPIKAPFEILENKKGINLNNNTLKAKTLNQQIKVRFGEKLDILFLVDSFNLILNIESKDEYLQNDKFGVMTSGYVKIVVDESSELKVNVSDRVVAGVTPIA